MIDESTRCYRHPDRPAATGCQRCDRPICSEDMKSASVGFHCPVCVKETGQQVYTAKGLQTQPQATMALIGLNVLAFLAQSSSSNELSAGWLFGPAVAVGEVYRLLTSGFLHGSLIHIGFNMYLLWMLGPPLEKAFGKVQFLILYFASLFGGAAAVMFFNWDSPTLGASGAVLGLAGGMGAVYAARGFSIRQSPAFSLIVLNLALPLIVGGISFWGHLGGIAGGALAAGVLVWLPSRGIVPKNAIVPLGVLLVVALAVLGVIGSELALTPIL